MMKFRVEPLLKYRILVDIDNDRPYHPDIVLIRETATDFQGNIVLLHEGDYIYTITENFEEGIPDHILAEGYVVENPYKTFNCNLCCKIEGEILYLSDY